MCVIRATFLSHLHPAVMWKALRVPQFECGLIAGLRAVLSRQPKILASIDVKGEQLSELARLATLDDKPCLKYENWHDHLRVSSYFRLLDTRRNLGCTQELEVGISKCRMLDHEGHILFDRTAVSSGVSSVM
jgi:hypothetical protein